MLVTCRSNDVTSLEVMLLEVTSLTNDVGHLPVTSSYMTYYYHNYFESNVIRQVMLLLITWPSARDLPSNVTNISNVTLLSKS